MKIVGIPKCVPLVLPSQRDSLPPFSSSLALSSKTKIERNKSYPLKINIIYFCHKISIFLICAHKFFKQMRDLHSENRWIKRKERELQIELKPIQSHPTPPLVWTVSAMWNRQMVGLNTTCTNIQAMWKECLLSINMTKVIIW